MSKKGKPVNLPLSVIVRDPRLQGRDDEDMDQDHLDQLAEAYRQKKPVPRPHVYEVQPEGRDENNRRPEPVFYVVNGFYRTTAAGRAGRVQLPVLLFKGTWEEAVIAAAEANKDQTAKNRTNADKRRQVSMMLAVCPKWSNRKIAEHVGVSDEMVRLRRAAATPDEAVPDDETREGRDGRQHAAKKGKRKTGDPDWRQTPINKFLKATPQVWKALGDAGLETAGQLWDCINKGQDIGLTPATMAALAGEVRELMPEEATQEAEPARKDGPDVPWGIVENVYGQLVRYTDRIARDLDAREQPGGPHVNGRDHKRALHLLGQYLEVLTGWKPMIEVKDE